MNATSAIKSIDELPPNIGFRVGYSLRSDGNMSYRMQDDQETVLKNRKQFFAQAEVPADRMMNFFTEHSDDIHLVQPRDLLRNGIRGENIATTDAVFTALPQTGVFLTFADCVPYIVYDAELHLLVFAHIGWRSMAMHFTRKVHAHLSKEFGSDPANRHVVIGPSIKKESYLFENAIQAENPAWQPFLETRNDGKTGIDLFGFCLHETAEAGIAGDRIYAAPVDTAIDDGMFSHYAGTVGERPEKQGRFIFWAYLA